MLTKHFGALDTCVNQHAPITHSLDFCIRLIVVLRSIRRFAANFVEGSGSTLSACQSRFFWNGFGFACCWLVRHLDHATDRRTLQNQPVYNPEEGLA